VKTGHTKSPTARLLVGLLVTLAAVTAFCWYSLFELGRLRQLQTDTIDRNRHDSLLLSRVQNDLNTLTLKLRDMADTQRQSSIGEYRGEFAALRTDLEDALREEARVAPGMRRTHEQTEFAAALQQFWRTSDRVFAEASAGHEAVARRLASTQLSGEQSEAEASVSRLIARNNEVEDKADDYVASIYSRAEQDIYAFLAAAMIAIVSTSLYLIYYNRRIFERLQSLSRQRKVLAARLITIQEEVLRSVSRELHDEFGQILTAIGAMLARADRKGLPPDSPLRSELSEVREITSNTLEKMRSLSQMLHPTVIDDYGLAKGIEWYAQVFQRQMGIEVRASVIGNPVLITGQTAIHCFRIVQEALNNVAKHSGGTRADVEMLFSVDTVKITVRDFGRGIDAARKDAKPGLGLIAMRERAALVDGTLEISAAPGGGTFVVLTMPLRQDDRSSEAAVATDFEDEEVLIR